MEERNIAFMFYALAIAWGLLFGYLATLAARQRRLQRELDNLRKIVQSQQEAP